MENIVKNLLEKRRVAEEIIEREEFNVSLYNRHILSEVNKSLEYTKCLWSSIDTVEKFAEYTKKYKLTDINQIYDYKKRDYTYSFAYKGQYFKVVIPLYYSDLEDLTPYLLEDCNYCKLRLYITEEKHIHKMIDCFKDLKSVLEYIKEVTVDKEVVYENVGKL